MKLYSYKHLHRLRHYHVYRNTYMYFINMISDGKDILKSIPLTLRQEYVHITGVYLTFTTGVKVQKTASQIDYQTVYVHMHTLENSRCNKG